MKAEEEARTDKNVCDEAITQNAAKSRDGTVIMRDPEEKKKRREIEETDDTGMV